MYFLFFCLRKKFFLLLIEDIEKLCDENKELHKRYDDLQHGDIYKRKEVLQLCDKFEQMKAKYLKYKSFCVFLISLLEL